MLAFEAVSAIRVVAESTVLDALATRSDRLAVVPILRIAPDELLIIGRIDQVDIADEHALIEMEDGLVADQLTWPEFETAIRPHLDWTLPTTRPSAALGLVAAVPCQLWLTDSDVLVMTYACYAHELRERVLTR